MTWLLMVIGSAWAGGVGFGPTVAAVGDPDVGLRPGVRFFFEPVESAALEVTGDASLDGRWDAGLGLVGRWWFAGDAGAGVYGLGRLVAGVSGADGEVGPWTGLGLGFGGRPIALLDLAVSAGPEWALTSGPRWRTELGLSFVFNEHTFQGGPAGGSVRHRPRKPR